MRNPWRGFSVPMSVTTAMVVHPDQASAVACDIGDGVPERSAFGIATAPTAGEGVSSGFRVHGCSRTFEGTVVWRLCARDGSVPADGFTMGGAVDGPGAFAFTMDYSIGGPQVGHLAVFEEDVSDSKGAAPGRTVLLLILQP